MNKYKNYIIIVSSILIVIVVNMLNSHQDSQSKTKLDYPIQGLGFFIKDNGEIVKEVNINKIEEYDFVLVNNSESDKELLLSILYEYIQEEFKVGNEITNCDKITIKKQSELVLPIKLRNKDGVKSSGSYIFTFIESENKVLEKELNYTFIVKTEASENNKKIQNEYENITDEDIKLDGLNITTQTENEDNILTKSDKVNIPIILGGGDSTEYLVYCLVNGKQKYIDDKPVKRYLIKEKHAIKDNIEISLESKGINNIRLYIVENPESETLKSSQIESSKTLKFLREE
ncbi:MAG: hypothetical protein ACRC6F_10965 [Aeromonas sp.]